MVGGRGGRTRGPRGRGEGVTSTPLEKVRARNKGPDTGDAGVKTTVEKGH